MKNKMSNFSSSKLLKELSEREKDQFPMIDEYNRLHHGTDKIYCGKNKGGVDIWKKNKYKTY